MRALRYFRWEVNAVIIAGICALVVVWQVRTAGARYEDHKFVQDQCALAVDVLVRQRPVLDRTMRLADPCDTLRRMRGAEGQ